MNLGDSDMEPINGWQRVRGGGGTFLAFLEPRSKKPQGIFAGNAFPVVVFVHMTFWAYQSRSLALVLREI